MLAAGAASASPLATIGGLVSAGGALASGYAQNQQAQYGAKVAEKNASTARMAGNAEADRIDLKYDKLRGNQVAAAAASGVNSNAGSASTIINNETGRNEALDRLSSLWSADNAAQGFEAQAKGLRLQGKNAQTASYIQAPASFIGGLAGNKKARLGDADYIG